MEALAALLAVFDSWIDSPLMFFLWQTINEFTSPEKLSLGARQM